MLLTLQTPFLNGSTPLLKTPKIPSPSACISFSPPSTPSFSIQAAKTLQGRVVCATNDKTVAVEVVRLAQHPRYTRRIRIKKKYQAHDEENKFKVGDVVQLIKGRPISKMKSYVAVEYVSKDRKKPSEIAKEKAELDLALESQNK